jgi:hypothetical protein
MGLSAKHLQVTSTLAAKEDLSLLMGEVRKLEAIFRHAKSRMAVPRPIGADDAEGIRLWQEAQSAVARFFTQSESCLARLEITSRLLSGMGEENLASLREVKSILELLLKKDSNAESSIIYREVIDWLTAAGV